MLTTLQHTTLMNIALTAKDREMWPFRDWLFSYAFMPLVYLPSSSAWTAATNRIRARLFPDFTEAQLRNFNLMYFASKGALGFDLVANHLLY